MRSKPFYLYCLIRKCDSHNKPVLIAHNIEYYPVITNQACIAIDFFQRIKIFEFAFQQFMIPHLQSNGRFRVAFTVVKQCFSGDDIKHVAKIGKVFY